MKDGKLRRLLSVFFSLVLVVGLAPIPAYAQPAGAEDGLGDSAAKGQVAPQGDDDEGDFDDDYADDEFDDEADDDFDDEGDDPDDEGDDEFDDEGDDPDDEGDDPDDESDDSDDEFDDPDDEGDDSDDEFDDPDDEGDDPDDEGDDPDDEGDDPDDDPDDEGDDPDDDPDDEGDDPDDEGDDPDDEGDDPDDEELEISYLYQGADGPFELIQYADATLMSDYVEIDEGEWDEVEWYVYDISQSEGDILYVENEEENLTYVLEADDDECLIGYVNEDDPDDIIALEDVCFETGQSYDDPWLEPGEYQVDVMYGDATTSFTVLLVENPIESIEYEPVSDLVVWESYGEIEYDDDGEIEWECYSVDFCDGDMIIITETDGTETSYAYDEESGEFVNGDEMLEQSDTHWVQLSTNQSYDNEWYPGCEDAEAYVEYMGVTSPSVTVYVCEAIEVPEVDECTFTYNGKTRTLDVPEDDAYTVTGNKAKNAGTYTATLTCEDGYVFDTGSRVETIEWEIERLPIDAPKAKSLTYNGKEQTGVAKGTGYSVKNGAATNAGTYKATATCDANHVFKDGNEKKTVSFTIKAASLKKATVTLKKSSSTYTGKSQKGVVASVKLAGVDLSSSDYKVTAKSGKSVGSYVVTVTGTGNCEDSATATFKITKAKNTAKAAKTSVTKSFKVSALKSKAQTVSLPDVTTKFGTAKWEVASKDGKGVLTLKDGKVQVKKGAKAGTYTIKLKAKVAGTKNYAEAKTGNVTVKVTVKK